jgi:NADPH:quinone reductase-like Zn-dependent oxidoreductase
MQCLACCLSTALEKVDLSSTAMNVTDESTGTAAEFVVVADDELAIKPSTLTHVEAASLPLVLYTARNSFNKADNLLKGGLRGKTVFIPGGLNGTGSLAIQLAKHVYGAARVITTVSTSKKPLIAQYLGEGTVDQIIDYKTQDVGKEVPPASVDFVYDTLGIMTSLIPLVKPDGVLLSIATLPRSELAKKDMPAMPFWIGWFLNMVNWYYSWKLSGKNINYDFVFGAQRNGDLDKVGEWVEEKKLKAVVGKAADFSDLKAMRDGCSEINTGTGTVGKFVIRLVSEDAK